MTKIGAALEKLHFKIVVLTGVHVVNRLAEKGISAAIISANAVFFVATASGLSVFLKVAFPSDFPESNLPDKLIILLTVPIFISIGRDLSKFVKRHYAATALIIDERMFIFGPTPGLKSPVPFLTIVYRYGILFLYPFLALTDFSGMISEIFEGKYHAAFNDILSALVMIAIMTYVTIQFCVFPPITPREKKAEKMLIKTKFIFNN